MTLNNQNNISKINNPNINKIKESIIHSYKEIQSNFANKINLNFSDKDFQQILYICPFYYIYQSINKTFRKKKKNSFISLKKYIK